MKDDNLKKLFEKLNSLDNRNLQIFVKRLWKERMSFKGIFDILGEGIIILSEKWEIEYSNRAANEIFGLENSDQQVLSKYVPSLAVILQAFNKKNEHNQFAVNNLEIFYPRKRLLNIIGTRISIEPKSVLYVLVITDSTDTNCLIEKQVASERFSTITLLASGVAHELGNPLNAISLRLQLMQKQIKHISASDERDRIQKSITVCEEEIERLDGITKNFLQAIRPQKPIMQPINIGMIIDRALTTLSPELSNLHISIIRKDKSFSIIMGDEKQLEQVIFNIIKNAIEAIDEHGKIVINSRYSDTQCTLEISDNGCGVSAENIQRISDPYFSTKKTGNGLGLMIVERILHEHKATFTIQSAIGEGTKITIIFPLKDPSLPFFNN